MIYLITFSTFEIELTLIFTRRERNQVPFLVKLISCQIQIILIIKIKKFLWSKMYGAENRPKWSSSFFGIKVYFIMNSFHYEESLSTKIYIDTLRNVLTNFINKNIIFLVQRTNPRWILVWNVCKSNYKKYSKHGRWLASFAVWVAIRMRE